MRWNLVGTLAVVAAAVLLAACVPPTGGGPPTPPVVVVTVGGDDVTFTGPAGSTLVVEVADPGTLPPAPPGATFPLGAFSIEVSGIATGSTVSVQVDLEQPVDGARKLITGAWDPFAHDGTTGLTVSTEGTTLTLDLQDGGRGDTDGVADGVIHDPVAPADLDTTPPDVAVQNVPVARAISAFGAPLSWTIIAIDDVDGPVPATCDHTSGAMFPPGETEVLCEAVDSAGNVGVGGFTARVIPLPVASAPLSLGVDSACMVRPDRTIHCWGSNEFGQLGIGTQTEAESPTPVSGITNGFGVDVGPTHACAVLTDATVRCWGNNWAGQLGDGTTTSSTVPVTVPGLSDVIQVTVGESHSCALLLDRSVRCWGDNEVAQLGNGTTVSSLAPVAVVGFDPDDPVEWIEAGFAHTCALTRQDEDVSCWGANDSGQVGNGSSADFVATASPVVGIDPADAYSLAIGSVSCVAADGVRCWGDGGTGAQEIWSGDDVYSIAVGWTHACARVSPASTVRCWGENSYGELGDGNVETEEPIPGVTVVGLSQIVQIQTGNDFSCAVGFSGEVTCWGRGQLGQIGAGAGVSSAVPLTVDFA